MGHKSLWQVGLSYLDHCPQDGIEVIKLLLPRLSLDSELRTQKILREALNRNLPEIGNLTFISSVTEKIIFHMKMTIFHSVDVIQHSFIAKILFE